MSLIVFSSFGCPPMGMGIIRLGPGSNTASFPLMCQMFPLPIVSKQFLRPTSHLLTASVVVFFSKIVQKKLIEVRAGAVQQRIKLLLATPALHIGVLIQVLTNTLSVQLPAGVSGKALDDGPSA